jgi:type II secretory pathway component PulF
MRLDSFDISSLSEEIEGNRKGYIVEIRRIGEPREAAESTKIPRKMLLAALESLELMLLSGIRINLATRTLAECAPPGAPRRLWTNVVLSIEETGSLGDTLRRFPKVFNESMIGIVSALEAAGRLADGIRVVRNYVAQMQEIRRESIRGAAYPILVCAAGAVSSAILCAFTLPRFSRMLTEIGVTKTNRITGFFFSISDLFVHKPGYMALTLSLPFLVAWLALRPRFRPIVDHFFLRLPVLRGAIEALVMARICVTFRALSESGVRIVEALESCAAVAGNARYSSGIRQVVAAVRENLTVGAGFERAGVFAPEVVLAVKSGEGSLPQVFNRLAIYYTSESKHRVALALQMVEPFMLILVLAWVFGVALAVILPVVEVINGIH